MPKTVKQVLAEQQKQAEDDRKRTRAVVPATPALPVVPDNRTPQERYLDEIAPSGIVGRLIKFSKEGYFIFADTDERVADTEDFVCFADQTLVSWVKFNDGEPPTRVGGLLYG